jgi:hypothetical protein
MPGKIRGLVHIANHFLLAKPDNIKGIYKLTGSLKKDTITIKETKNASKRNEATRHN